MFKVFHPFIAIMYAGYDLKITKSYLVCFFSLNYFGKNFVEKSLVYWHRYMI